MGIIWERLGLVSLYQIRRGNGNGITTNSTLVPAGVLGPLLTTPIFALESNFSKLDSWIQAKRLRKPVQALGSKCTPNFRFQLDPSPLDCCNLDKLYKARACFGQPLAYKVRRTP